METNGYVELFNELKSRVGSDEVALALVEQVGKDTRVERMHTRGSQAGNGFGNGDQPATSKQIGYLKVLGVDVPDDCTKQKASELIDAHSA